MEQKSTVSQEPGKANQGCARGIHPDPLQVISDEHALQLELCDLLEVLADSLPYSLDHNLVEVSVSILSKSWPQHLAIEEQCLFPLLRERAMPHSQLKNVIKQLEQEHNEDEDRADEIISALKGFLMTGRVQYPESLGYMLRGFFEAQRRHIIWENDVVLPAAREALTDDDIARMQAWMVTSKHPRCSTRSLIAIRDAQLRGNL